MRHRKRGNRATQPGPDQSGPDRVLDALLAGRPLPGEDQAGLRPVADVLAALRRPAAEGELSGQASAMAEFRARPHRPGRAARPRRRGVPVIGPLLTPRPMLALAAGAVVVAGLAAGAYEGDLPAPVQRLVQHFGLTAVRTTPSPSPPRPTPPPTPRAEATPQQHRPGPHRRGGQPAADREPHQKHHEHGTAPGGPGHQPGGRPGGLPGPGGQVSAGASSAPSHGPGTPP